MASFNYHQEQIMMNSSFDNNNNNDMVYYDYYNDSGDGEFFDLKPPPYSCEIFTPFSSTSSSSSCISDINGRNWSSQLENKKAAFSSSSSGPQVISFGNSSNSLFGLSDHNSDKFLFRDNTVCNKQKSVTRSPVQAQYHVEAERKRREKLSELFISLSKVIPGLKKLDKATLLGDAIKYMKELEERVKMLEEESRKTNSISMSMEFDTNGSSCRRRRDDDNNNPIDDDVRVRVMNNNLLIKIHCDKHQQQHTMNGSSFVARITSELEKLHLSILDIRLIPFGCSILDITILAQMDREYPPTAVKDIIKHLQQITGKQDETLINSNNNSFSDDYCFHHLSPLPGSEVWED